MCVLRSVDATVIRAKNRNMVARVHNKNAMHMQSTYRTSPVYGQLRNVDDERSAGNRLLRFWPMRTTANPA